MFGRLPFCRDSGFVATTSGFIARLRGLSQDDVANRLSAHRFVEFFDKGSAHEHQFVAHDGRFHVQIQHLVADVEFLGLRCQLRPDNAFPVFDESHFREFSVQMIFRGVFGTYDVYCSRRKSNVPDA